MADEYTAKLDTYLDGELSADEMKALDAHVRGCASCAAAVLDRVQLKRALQQAGQRYSPSQELRERVRRQITGKRPQRSPFQVWLTSAAVIAVLFLGGLLSSYLGRQGLRREQALSEVADLHVAALASANPVDVVSSDRHTVKPWFQGKIPFTFNLPELQNSEFTLVGGRLAYLHQAPGVELIFQIRKHYISVFIFQENAVSSALPAESGPRKHASFNFETWRGDGLRYIAISDTSAGDISKLAEMLKAASRS